MSKQQNSDATADPITLKEFINSLQRLFKIAIYYPSGHVILDKATDRFLGLIADLASDKTSVTLEESGNSLMIEGVTVDAGLPFVQELKDMLALLGISAIIFSREILGAEVHVFVRKMLSYKMKIVNAKQFSQIEVAELPHSITIRWKEFLARKNASISDDRAMEAAQDLQTFIDSLKKYGLNNEEIHQCKELLEALPQRIQQKQYDMGDLPYASWDDVARLLAQVVASDREAQTKKGSGRSTQSNINALAAILKSLEFDVHDRKSRETINLLVSIIKKPLLEGKETPDEDSKKRIFPDKPPLSVEKIQNHISKNTIAKHVLASIPETETNTETLSILMQMAQYSQAIQVQIRMQQLFREMLSGSIAEKTWQILSYGLQTIVEDGQSARVATIVRLLVEPLRRLRQGKSLYLFLQTIRLCDKEQSRLLWPYIVNEMLVEGSGSDQSSYHQLSLFASRLTPVEMAEGLPVLRGLEAFQNNTIAPDIFSAVSPACYPLFAFLYKTEIESYMGERIIGGLRRNPADWLIKAVVPVLDLSKQEHKLFLFSYLRQASLKKVSDSIKSVAAKIIAEALPLLPQERRNEEWVKDTIATLSELATAEIRAILENITRGKKLLFIPEWPTPCRKAAEETLLKIQKQR